MPYQFLIVDDERLNRSYIHDLITEFLPDAIIAEADSAKAALAILSKGTTDFLLLDIKMPDMDGFGLLRSLPEKEFELIFITAYSEYAIQAIKEGAVDYILKPIRKTEFRDMLTRVITHREAAIDQKHNAAERDYLSQKLAINHQNGRHLIALGDIVYLKADNSYTTVFLEGGQKVITTKLISKYEEALQPPWFFRIHKSYIIGLRHFKAYISREGGGIALMNEGSKLGISRYRLSAFLDLLESAAHIIKL